MIKKKVADGLLSIFEKEIDVPIWKWTEENITLKGTIEGRNGQKFPNWDLFPEMKEILEWPKDPETKKIFFNFSAQYTKTFSLLMLVMRFIYEGRVVLFVLPDMDKRDKIRDRLKRLIVANRDLLGFNDERGASEKDSFAFYNGGKVLFGILTSPSQLDETPADCVIIDEYDPYVNKAKAETISMIRRAENRLTSKANGLLLCASTASAIRGNGGITDWYESSKRHEVQMACPHCGEFHTWLYDDHFGCDDYNEEDLGTIITQSLGFMACPSCGAELRDSDHYEMQKTKRVFCLDEDKTKISMGAYANTWTGPNKNFSEIVHQYKESEDDPSQLADFYNSRESRPRDFSRMTKDIREGLNKADYELRCPPADCKVLAMGIDVQTEGRCYVVVVGFGYNGNVYLVYKNQLGFGDRSQLRNEIVRHVNKNYVENKIKNQMGESLPLLVVGIDVDPFRAEILGLQRESRLYQSVKGSGSLNQARRHSEADGKNLFGFKPYGMTTLMISSDASNDSLDSLLNADPDNGHAFIIPQANVTNDFLDHLANVVQRTKVQGSKTIVQWETVTSSARKDYRDALRYAIESAKDRSVKNYISRPSREVQQEEKAKVQASPARRQNINNLTSSFRRR